MPYSPKTWNLTDPITATDLNRIEVGIDEVTASVEDDTGWVTNAVTAASGWSISSQNVRRIGDIVRIDVSLLRTGGNLTVGASGDLSNATIATIASDYRPTVIQGLHCGRYGRLAAFDIQSDGVIELVATVPSDTIVNTDAMTISGTYLLG